MTAQDSLVGATIANKYRIQRLLGHGGMGSVYKAENMAIGRTVAVKVLHRHLADDGITVSRFHNEARAAASVGHDHVVDVLDMGIEANGTSFLVMEYVRGKSLEKVLRRDGPLEPRRAAIIAGQVLAGLGALHARGVVHRDLKPENVLLTVKHGQKDYVKVFDFGVAAFIEGVWEASQRQDLTPSGRTMGTPFYASPEQLAGEKARDARIDLYAVGVMMFEMLTGHRPFESKSFVELCRSIQFDAPPPMRVFRKDVPAELEAVVRRALSKDPAARYTDAYAMVEALVPFGAIMPELDEPEPTDTFTVDLRELQAREELLSAAGRTGDSEPPPASEEGLPLDVVRGELPSALIGFLHERLEPSVLDAVISRLPDEVRDMVQQGFSASAWYPDDVLSILDVADEVAGTGDRKFIAAAGRYFARQAFGANSDILRRTITPELLFAMAHELWRRYFALGEPRVVKVGRGYGRFEVRAHPHPRVTRGVALVGFLSEALRMVGARDVDVRLTRSTALGDEADVFEATWAS